MTPKTWILFSSVWVLSSQDGGKTRSSGPRTMSLGKYTPGVLAFSWAFQVLVSTRWTFRGRTPLRFVLSWSVSFTNQAVFFYVKCFQKRLFFRKNQEKKLRAKNNIFSSAPVRCAKLKKTNQNKIQLKSSPSRGALGGIRFERLENKHCSPQTSPPRFCR